MSGEMVVMLGGCNGRKRVVVVYYDTTRDFDSSEFPGGGDPNLELLFRKRQASNLQSLPPCGLA